MWCFVCPLLFSGPLPKFDVVDKVELEVKCGGTSIYPVVYLVFLFVAFCWRVVRKGVRTT